MSNRKTKKWLFIATLAHSTVVLGQWTGGPVIIGGDDADNHFDRLCPAPGDSPQGDAS